MRRDTRCLAMPRTRYTLGPLGFVFRSTRHRHFANFFLLVICWRLKCELANLLITVRREVGAMKVFLWKIVDLEMLFIRYSFVKDSLLCFFTFYFSTFLRNYKSFCTALLDINSSLLYNFCILFLSPQFSHFALVFF